MENFRDGKSEMSMQNGFQDICNKATHRIQPPTFDSMMDKIACTYKKILIIFFKCHLGANEEETTIWSDWIAAQR